MRNASAETGRRRFLHPPPATNLVTISMTSARRKAYASDTRAAGSCAGQAKKG